MSKVAVLNIKGEKIKEYKLNDKVWNIKPNDVVLHDAIVLANASLRQGTHSTKTRAEVSGGGRKPWRQKGTGNARQGSIRSPQWRKGGIVFGPTPEKNYNKKMNKKERKLAFQSALTYKALKEKIIMVDNLNVEDNKTKTMIEVFKNIKAENNRLIVTTELNENLILGSRNLKKTKILLPNEMSVLDIMNNDSMIITEDAMKVIEEVFV